MRYILIKDNEDPNFIYGYIVVDNNFNIEKFQKRCKELRYAYENEREREDCLEELHKEFEFSFVGVIETIEF